MNAMVSQITSLTIAYSSVYSGADQRKHERSASLAFVRGIHRWPVNCPHKETVTPKMLPFDDVIMMLGNVRKLPVYDELGTLSTLQAHCITGLHRSQSGLSSQRPEMLSVNVLFSMNKLLVKELYWSETPWRSYIFNVRFGTSWYSVIQAFYAILRDISHAMTSNLVHRGLVTPLGDIDMGQHRLR